ncbi:hypothetical protein M067_4953 [Bacteroides fragilis str. J-143-4]|nr:hypothetical protein M067_4953 [Bacteroides fragilis str. J-143-4]
MDLLRYFIKILTPEEKQLREKEMEEMERNYNLLVEISGGSLY